MSSTLAFLNGRANALHYGGYESFVHSDPKQPENNEPEAGVRFDPVALESEKEFSVVFIDRGQASTLVPSTSEKGDQASLSDLIGRLIGILPYLSVASAALALTLSGLIWRTIWLGLREGVAMLSLYAFMLFLVAIGAMKAYLEIRRLVRE